MKSEDIDNLDKASVMRLSISFLKVRTMVDLSEYLIRFHFNLDGLALFDKTLVIVTKRLKWWVLKATNIIYKPYNSLIFKSSI